MARWVVVLISRQTCREVATRRLTAWATWGCSMGEVAWANWTSGRVMDRALMADEPIWSDSTACTGEAGSVRMR